jgi:hypothetical protein
MYFYEALHVSGFEIQVDIFRRIVFNNYGAAVVGSVVAVQISVQTFNYLRFL